MNIILYGCIIIAIIAILMMIVYGTFSGLRNAIDKLLYKILKRP